MSNSATPKVSIVMPVLRTRFLRQAIESALDQDYPSLEVVVVDDGSSEKEMPGLLEGFAKSHPERFRFERQENQGQPRTINRAMELATGEFAGYLSDDDLFRPGAVRRLADVLLEDPTAVVAYPVYEIIDEQETVLDTITPTEYSLVDSVRLHDSIVGAGALYRTEAFRQIGGWDTELSYRGDYDYWLRLSLLGKMRRVVEPLAAFRLHEKGRTISDAGVRMARESIRVLDKFYAEDGLPEEVRAVRGEAYRNAFIQAAMVLTLGRSDPAERFYVFDRHMPKISKAAAASAASPDALLNVDVTRLDAEVRELREQVIQRDAMVAYLGRPWWWRMFRRATPRGLRPLAKRVGGRFLPGKAAERGA